MKQLFTSLLLSIGFISYSNHISCQDLDSARFIIKEKIFQFVEAMPTFPGGESAMLAYINSNLIYPKMAKENGIEGRVVVVFVVDTNGYVHYPKIIRSIGGGCDQEVLRIMYNFPRWEPGKQNNKPVNIMYTLPVKFTLSDKSQKK